MQRKTPGVYIVELASSTMSNNNVKYILGGVLGLGILGLIIYFK